MKKFLILIFIGLLLIEYFLVRIIFDLAVNLSLIQINSFLLSLLIYLLIDYLDKNQSINFFNPGKSTKGFAIALLFPQIAFMIWHFNLQVNAINYICVFFTIMMFFLPFSEFYLKKEE
jgi:hypothetical protein